jgi:hypothetical protein
MHVSASQPHMVFAAAAAPPAPLTSSRASDLGGTREARPTPASTPTTPSVLLQRLKFFTDARPAAPPPARLTLPFIGDFDVGEFARGLVPRALEQNTLGGLPIDRPRNPVFSTPAFELPAGDVALPSYVPPPGITFGLNPQLRLFGAQLNPSVSIPLGDADLKWGATLDASLRGVELGPVDGRLTFGIGRPNLDGVRTVGTLGARLDDGRVDANVGFVTPTFNNNGAFSFETKLGSQGVDFSAGLNVRF